MPTADELETRHTLLTAVTHYDDLRMRDTLAATAARMNLDHPERTIEAPALGKDDALQLLALGEAIIRKARYGRQLAVRSARAAGASWSQIGEALGMSKQAAWEAHSRWIDALAAAHRHREDEGPDDARGKDARRLTGALD